MKKINKTLPLLLLMILSACSGDTSSSASISNSSSTDPNTSDSSTSLDSESSPSSEAKSEEVSESSSEDSSSSETTQVKHITSLLEAKNLAYALQSSVNERNVAEDTTVEVVLDAELRTVHDFIATQSGYNTRYKGLIANEEGYIFVGMKDTHYNYVKDFRHKQNVYTFKGYVSLYNGNPEITLTDKPILRAGEKINPNLEDTHDKYTSISNIHNDLDNILLNSKGVNFSIKPVEISLKYIMKIENEIALFSDGTQVIQIHGDSYVNNNFDLNNVYEITILPGKYLFKMQGEYISKKTSSKVINTTFNEDNALTAADLYKHKYERDSDSYSKQNKEYGRLFNTVYYFEGYVNIYDKDGRSNIIFEDIARDAYSTMNNLGTNKALVDNNANSTKIPYDEPAYSVFIEQGDTPKEEKSLVRFNFIAYDYNTQKYWQVQAFESTYKIVE